MSAVAGFGLCSYTSVSTRSRSILRTLPSTATRLVMEREKLSGNQPVSPSRSLSPCSQPGCRRVGERGPSYPPTPPLLLRVLL